MNQFTIGAHLKVNRTGYTHHGVYVGDGQVIHYAGLCNGFNAAPVEIVSLKDFQGKADKINIVTYDDVQCFSPEEIIKRANSRLGENRYNVVFNNCEHFANWCITGRAESKQVKNAVKAVASFLSMSAILLSSNVMASTIHKISLLF